MVVKYDNGYEETISNALKNERISIDDLDSYDISYIKEEKEKVFIETSVEKNCDKKAKLYYSDSNVNVYTYCLNSVNVTINDKAYNLSDYFKLGGTIHSNMDFIVNKLIDSEFFKDALIYKDGGSAIYRSTESSIAEEVRGIKKVLSKTQPQPGWGQYWNYIAEGMEAGVFYRNW